MPPLAVTEHPEYALPCVPTGQGAALMDSWPPEPPLELLEEELLAEEELPPPDDEELLLDEDELLLLLLLLLLDEGVLSPPELDPLGALSALPPLHAQSARKQSVTKISGSRHGRHIAIIPVC
jgi:hypothetical protein